MANLWLVAPTLLFKIVELEILLCALRQGEPLASIVDSVCEEEQRRIQDFVQGGSRILARAKFGFLINYS